MRGSIRKRYEKSWSVIVELAYVTDPVTGKKRRKQQWITVEGSKRDAQKKLNDVLAAVQRGDFIEPSKLTVGEWLADWVEKAVKPPAKRLNTYSTYKRFIEKDVAQSFLNDIRLQQLKSTDLKRFYGELKVSESTKAKFHAILHSALKAATLEGLVTRNVAALVIGKPRSHTRHEDIRSQCWTAEETRTFLVEARKTSAQAAAFYTLAIETGMRKGELCGLRWEDVNFDTGKVQVIRQLIKPGEVPVYGPPKSGSPRTVDIGKDTVQLLREHKRHQAEFKLKNRVHYHDHGLVFAKEWGELTRKHDVLGEPLQINNLGQRDYAALIEAAGVRPIKFHGLRHTCATLLFSAGVPVKVIQERLGHKRVEITLGIYAHVLPSMQQDAVSRLGALLNL